METKDVMTFETNTFDLKEFGVQFRQGDDARAFKVDNHYLRKMMEDDKSQSGLIMKVYHVRSSTDAHSDYWEMHPHGDEFLCLTSGQMDIVIDGQKTKIIRLEPFTGFIVPAGCWHRLLVGKASTLIVITPREGTKFRKAQLFSNLNGEIIEEWKKEVFPHSEFQQLEENLWVIQGEYPQSQLPRNMVIYRYNRDQLLLHSVVALNENGMEKLEALGKPTLMIVPHWDHYAHLQAFKKRYPDIQVICPQASRDKVKKRVSVDDVCENFFPKYGIKFYIPPGIAPYEGVFELPLNNGKTALMVNDLITNVPHQPGIYGLILRMTASTGKPNVIPLVKFNLKVQGKPLKGFFQDLQKRYDLGVITTSHGNCITRNISKTLSEIAKNL